MFVGVHVPFLWGTRAVIQDRESRLSIIDLRAWKKTSVVMIVYKLRQGSYNGRW
jgi:hypothetical protein